MSNSVLESIHQVLWNLVQTFNISTQTYVDKNDPWTGILAAEAFAICSKTNGQKGYSPGQLIFFRDVILHIDDTLNMIDWMWQVTMTSHKVQFKKKAKHDNIIRLV